MILLEAARACGSSPRFVYLSAAGVREGTKNPYYRARARVERALAESGLACCIAQPSFITDPDRDDGRPLERAGAALADGLLRAAGLLGAHTRNRIYESEELR